jgi:peptide chain release factor 1
MTHKPTGIQAKASSRCQHANRREARAMLETRVAEHYRHQANQEHAADKRAQLGTGQRGDKTRTYRCQDDVVIDHASGTKSRLRDILKGMLP